MFVSFPGLAGALLLLVSLPVAVYPAAIPHDDHDHVSPGALPDSWYHDEGHFAHKLFKRQATTPPQVGSPTWVAQYPAGTPDSNAMPQAWKDALNAAVQAGKIPNIPPATQSNPNAAPAYPAPFDPHSPQVCSGSFGCRIAGNIYDAPPGVMALSFDDGPLPPSDNLYGFLRQNQVKATHFFIGTNIIRNWNQFNTAFQVNQDDIAVHTWTHPHMTALSNADVVAQLGWTLQVIYDSTGGRLSRYWRPPYGDVDVRVTSIAKEVFGLTTVVWNQDTEDWTFGSPGGTTAQAVQAFFQRVLSGPQTPGLVILQHELSDAAVNSFIAAFPLIKQYNWNLQSLASVLGLGPYQNAIGATGQPTSVALTAGGNGGAGLTVTASSTTSTPPSPTTSSTSTSSSQATALPDNGVKSSDAAPGLRSPPLTLSLSALALVLSFCLF